MDNNDKCRESILDDIVKVELYKTANCTIPLPFSIALSSINNATLGQPVISFSVGDMADCELADSPVLKVTSDRHPSGLVYTHDLQMTLTDGEDTARSALNTLVGVDFIAVYTLADGSRRMTYSCPSTSSYDVEDTSSSASTLLVKVKMLSMSNRIKML